MASTTDIKPIYLTSLMLGKASDPIFAIYILDPSSSWAWSLEASSYLKIFKLRNILLNLPNILANLGGPLLKDPTVKCKDVFVADSVIKPLSSEIADVGNFLNDGCPIPFPHKFSRRVRNSFVSYEFPSDKAITADSEEFVKRCVLFRDGFDNPEEDAAESVLRFSRQLKHVTRYVISTPNSTDCTALKRVLETADKILRMILIFETVGLQLKISDAFEAANASSEDEDENDSSDSDAEDEYAGVDEDEKNYKGTVSPRKKTILDITDALKAKISLCMREQQLRAEYEERLELNEALQQQQQQKQKRQRTR